jgi:hypothetical protein
MINSPDEPTTRKAVVRGRIRLFEDFLGLVPTSRQLEIANAVLRTKLALACIERGEESTLLIAAIALWYAAISDSLEVFVYADTGDRAKEVIRTVRDLYEQLPRPWKRGCSTDHVLQETYVRFFGAGSVQAEPVGPHINPWHDIIIVDGAEAMNCDTATDLAYCGRQPLDDRRVLIIGSEETNLLQRMDATGLFTRVISPSSEPAQ